LRRGKCIVIKRIEVTAPRRRNGKRTKDEQKPVDVSYPYINE